MATSNQTEFYLLRKQEAEDKAAQSKLDNVRDNHLRSAESWAKLAERSIRSDAQREVDRQRKADQAVEEARLAAEQLPPQIN